MTTAIWWIRRDLRLGDNQALTAALSHASHVIPLFILDPFFQHSPYVAKQRQAFLWEGLHQLEAALRQRGSYLVVREGNPVAVLSTLMAETETGYIFAEEDFSTYARRRDTAVAQQLPLQLVSGLTVRHPNTLIKPDSTPYTVYTPFKNAWMKRPLPTRQDLLPAPPHLHTPDHLYSHPLPTAPYPSLFSPGEEIALHQLTTFTCCNDHSPVSNIFHYATQRNRLDIEGSAKLSPYLRFGMISLRQAAVAALEAWQLSKNQEEQEGAEAWLNELIWREFYLSILYHFPQVLHRSFHLELQHIPWSNNQAEFQTWCEGETGYPVVDAAMHQLLQTGWMHNRARMITASFLVKNLLINWQWGEQWFMQHLIDGDPAANNGGWQWTAGTGTDAAPYFRIFNPVVQSTKFDPYGHYIRRYVPALNNVPDPYIHAPWEMPLQLQKQVGCIIGRDYPYPMIDHHTTREQTLAAYRAARHKVEP